MSKLKLKSVTEKALEFMYTDVVSVYRYIRHEDEFGGTSMKIEDEPTYKNLPCRLSYSSENGGYPGLDDVDGVAIEDRLVLFTRPGYMITKGDYIEIRRKDDNGDLIVVETGTVGTVKYYPSHIEAPISDRGKA